jgi:hypothetical protein
VVSIGDVAARRAALRRLKEAGCALVTEETGGSRAQWRAAARYLSRGACVASTGGSDLVVKD